MGTIRKSLVALALLASSQAWGVTTILRESVIPEALSETIPTAFAPNDIQPEDFVIEWQGKALDGVTLKLAPGSLQWVRVAEVLVVPRARLFVNAERTEGGRVTTGGFSQTLTRPTAAEPFHAEMPIALVSGEVNPIEISVLKGAKKLIGEARLRFKPRASSEVAHQRVFFDSSCSRFGLRASGSATEAQAQGWVYVGCRLATVRTTGHRTTSLEAYVFWDGVGQTVDVGGVETPATSASIWPLRLRSEPREIRLAAGHKLKDQLVLNYSTPEYFHNAFIGLGIGPYISHFDGEAGEYFHGAVPIATLYGSYSITETFRIVAFDATTLNQSYATDFGIYVSSEYFRFLDQRIAVNVMLGGHVNAFRSNTKYYVIPGFPQGIEGTYFDFLFRGYNFTAGAFVYPEVSGKYYYNMWLRYGTGRWFGEVNLIAWGERFGTPGSEIQINTRAAGISFGMPIFRFL